MMSAADKALLEENRPKLMQGIDLKGCPLFAELRARNVISQQNQEVIEEEAGNSNRVGKLLDMLLRGDENCMDMFIYALRASGLRALADTCLRNPVKMT